MSRDAFYERQQDLIDHMMSQRLDKMKISYDLWTCGPVSKEEERLLPTLRTIHDMRVEAARPRPRRNGRGFPHATSDIWILIDSDNSNARSKNYLWWFETRAIALRHKNWQNKIYRGATLVGPYHYKKARR